MGGEVEDTAKGGRAIASPESTAGFPVASGAAPKAYRPACRAARSSHVPMFLWP